MMTIVWSVVTVFGSAVTICGSLVTIFGSLAKICGVGDYLGLDVDICMRFGVGS